MADAAEDIQENESSSAFDFTEGELSPYFPLSPLFAVKKSFGLILLIAFAICLMVFQDDAMQTTTQNMREAMGTDSPIVYNAAVFALLLLMGYWTAYIKTFRFGVEDGMFYIRKGVFIRETFDYPITSIENTGIKRDYLDILFGTCTIQIMTAHEASDDLAAIRGISIRHGERLHKFMRQIVNDYQSSRYDIKDLQREVAEARAARAAERG